MRVYAGCVLSSHENGAGSAWAVVPAEAPAEDEVVRHAFDKALRAVGLASAILAGSAAPCAQAEAPTGFAAAMGISSADGTVHTQAGVHLALTSQAGEGEVALERARSVLAARMPQVRGCFSEAMRRSAGVDGSVVLTLQAKARGRLKAEIKHDGSNDAAMAECMRDAFSGAVVRTLPVGAQLEATLAIDNPGAKLHRMQAQRSVLEGVRMLGGGLAESRGGTQAEEVAFRVVGSAYASETIGALQQEFLTALPGLLDCRRKASRRSRAAEGSLSLDISIEQGRIARVQTKSSSMNDRRAPTCINAWLSRVDASNLAAAELDVTVSFAR